MKFLLYLFVATLLVCLPVGALAELPEDVTDDFAVISGVVVMPINDEYIVDLDSRNNLYVGDILTVVEPGQKIIHPETGAVIGAIDNVLGFLQVTRIYSGYSYAKIITAGLAPANGASIKRFEQVPATIVASPEANKEIAREVQLNLPQFKWLESGAPGALLTFNLEKQALDVLTAQGDSLHRYKISEDQQLVSSAITAQRPTVVTQSKRKRPLQQLADSLVGAIGGSTNEDRFAEMDEAIIRQKQSDRQGIWMGPNIEGNPRALAVADLDGDGQQETAVVMDNRLLITRIVAGEYSEVAEMEIPIRLKVLNMNALDLDGNGRAELYCTALSGYDTASFVVESTGEGYAIVIDDVRLLLNALPLPGQEGLRLLGQKKVEDEQPFYGNVFVVQREGDRLVEGEALTLPVKLNIFNFLPFSDDRGQLNYAYLTKGDYLKVLSAAGGELFTSPDYYSGSENCYLPRKELTDEVMVQTCMPQRMLVMPGNEILVAQNEGQRFVKNLPLYKKSRLVSLGWTGFTLQESWRTASQPGYMADFAYADADNDGEAELVMAVRFQKEGLIDKSRTSLVTYELE